MVFLGKSNGCDVYAPSQMPFLSSAPCSTNSVQHQLTLASVSIHTQALLGRPAQVDKVRIPIKMLNCHFTMYTDHKAGQQANADVSCMSMDHATRMDQFNVTSLYCASQQADNDIALYKSNFKTRITATRSYGSANMSSYSSHPFG